MRKERGGSGSGRAGRSPVRTLDKFVLQNMEELMNVLESTLNIDFIRGTISGPRNRDGIIKVKIRPLEKRENCIFSWNHLQRHRHSTKMPDAERQKR